MDELIAWLDSNIPEDDGRRTLVHGDYRIDNMLFAEDSSKCVAVLDWELSTIGHPFADLAALIMQWQCPTGKEGRGLAGVDRKALGIQKIKSLSKLIAPAWGCPAFRILASIWRSVSSVWAPSCRVSKTRARRQCL